MRTHYHRQLLADLLPAYPGVEAEMDRPHTTYTATDTVGISAYDPLTVPIDEWLTQLAANALMLRDQLQGVGAAWTPAFLGEQSIPDLVQAARAYLQVAEALVFIDTNHLQATTIPNRSGRRDWPFAADTYEVVATVEQALTRASFFIGVVHLRTQSTDQAVI